MLLRGSQSGTSGCSDNQPSQACSNGACEYHAQRAPYLCMQTCSFSGQKGAAHQAQRSTPGVLTHTIVIDHINRCTHVCIYFSRSILFSSRLLSPLSSRTARRCRGRSAVRDSIQFLFNIRICIFQSFQIKVGNVLLTFWVIF